MYKSDDNKLNVKTEKIINISIDNVKNEIKTKVKVKFKY